MTLSIPKGTPRLLRDLVHEHTGVYFDDNRLDGLVDKLHSRVFERGFTSVLDYYYLLKYDSEASAEWPRVLDVLAVPETYFWREVDQLKVIVDLLLPECSRAARPGPVRIWCAAAATGEEPLTLAMLLDQKGLLRSGEVAISASDGSQQLIDRAARGVFRERSLRLLPPEFKSRYFENSPNGWGIDPAITAHVRWTSANLRDRAAVATLADAHIILCRNVFIYFSDDAVCDAVRSFADHMRTPAWLCLGASESLLRLKTPFDLHEAGGAFVYRRKQSIVPEQRAHHSGAEVSEWTG